ncbi:MAG TPA: protoporphyrinogen oxidase [Bryobacteraceae bacterium]|nr:protoporphyrinogen oxidase [Bryobacteraceae bacterium]
MRPVVIIGGGISGLSTAYYLSRQGIPSRIIERTPRLGGVIQTGQVAGCLIEAGPDSFVTFKPWALQLIRELGLGNQIIGSNDHLRATYIWKRGRMVKMPEGINLMVPARTMPIITTSLLSWPTKLRMAAEWFRAPRPMNGDRSVSEFVEDHYGREVVDYLTEPLLAGVYGGNSDEMSVRAVLPRFVEWEAMYGSLSRAAKREIKRSSGTLFSTLKGGLSTLIEELVRQTGSALEIIHGDAEEVAPGWRVRVSGDWLETDHIVLACAAWQAAKLTAAELAGLLASIPYTSSTIVALVYNRAEVHHPLNGFGFLVPRVERKSLTACTWVNTKFSHRVPDDKVALRCFMHGNPDHAEDEIREKMGITANPVARQVTQWPMSMAQYTVGHESRVQQIEAMLAQAPGLYLAGNAYYGIGIPDCVRMGKAAAEKIAGNMLNTSFNAS